MSPKKRARIRCWPLVTAILAGLLPALGVMYNLDTGDQKSRDLALLPPFQSKASLTSIGCSAVLIAPDAALCASHCVNYAATGTVAVSWNGQTRNGTFWTTGADVIAIKLDSAFTGAAGKCTAPYAGATELNRLAWKVASGGSGVIGTGSTAVAYDGIFRAMTNRLEVNNVANPPAAVTADWLYYDMDDAPSAAVRPTTLYEGGTAPGDSGGPLYMYEGGRWWVIGVTSGPDAGYYRDGRVRTDLAEIETRTGHTWAQPVTPALEMKWVAQDLVATNANGAAIASWPRQGGTEAWTNAAANGGVGTATLTYAATPTARAAVTFAGSARLGLPAASNPVAGETSFTVALVFKANAAGAGAEGQWFDNTGLIDADEAGTTNDWGLALASTGRAGFGAGNADTTNYSAGATLADGNWHVIVASWDGAEVTGDAAGTDKNLTVFVDDVAAVTRKAGPEFLDVARNAASLALGGSRASARYLNGAIAEVRLYRGALDDATADALLKELRTTYVAPPFAFALTSPAKGRAGIPLGQGLLVEGTLTGVAPTVTITQTAGPASAVISPIQALPAGITFPAAGTYRFDVTAADGAQTLTEPLLVEILPAIALGWNAQDVGAVAAAGSHTLVNGTFNVSASGADIWNTADEYYSIHKSVTGDCRIQGRVVSVEPTDPWAKAGLMIRGSLAADSANAALLVSAANGITRQYRATTGGSSLSNATAGLAAPYWLRLERRGDTFHSFRSTDGVTWIAHQPAVTVALPAAAVVGLAVTSHADGTLCGAVLDNVTVTPIPANPALTLGGAWTASNLGDAATAGSQTLGASTASLTGSGLGFQEVSDSLRLVWQPLTGDGSITARVASFAADNGGSAFGGVMLRSTLRRESANVAATVRSAGDVRFSRRTEDGAYTSISTAALSKPLWVRLTRSGDTFTCFDSTDGVAWTQLGPAETIVGAPATMLAGLLVASLNNNGNSVATFDNVTLAEAGATPVAPTLELPGGQNPNAANGFTITAQTNGTPTWTWEKISGPGSVTFATQNTAAPKTAFSQKGSYLLRASADDGSVKTFVESAFSFALDARWDFTAGAEGWTGANAGTLVTAGGALSGTATSGDPQVFKNAAVYVSGDLAKHLLVKYRGTAAGNAQWFWGRVGAGGFAGGRSATASYTPANAWKTLLFDVTAHPEWAGRILTDLRFDPAGSTGAAFDIDWFALSDGDFDGDGIPDLVETTADTDGDGLANLEDPDSDNDTLPDAWEYAHGLNPYSGADAALDKDGDGQSNLAEYLAGTNPASAADVLRVSSAIRTGTSFTANVAGKAARRYVLERKSALSGATWTAVFTSATLAADGPVSLTDSAAPASAAFYRVRAEWP